MTLLPICQSVLPTLFFRQIRKNLFYLKCNHDYHLFSFCELKESQYPSSPLSLVVMFKFYYSNKYNDLSLKKDSPFKKLKDCTRGMLPCAMLPHGKATSRQCRSVAGFALYSSINNKKSDHKQACIGLSVIYLFTHGSLPSRNLFHDCSNTA